MKIYYVLLAFCGATLAAIVAAVVIAQHHRPPAAPIPAEQVFEVKGQVRSVEPDEHTLNIAHEEIPGFMPAMVMPFTVKEPATTKGLASGDAVRFRLVVSKDDSWITQIEKIAPGALSAPPAAEQGAVSGSETERVEVGQKVPDFSLVDHHGKKFRLSDLQGKAVVLTFIYTRCPLPNFCPLMSKNFASLQERFCKDLPGKVQLLSISFDPEFDTPETLSRYAALFQGQNGDKDWRFATGTPEQINHVTAMFGLIREPANGFINHDLRTALISPEGKLVHIWRSNVWTPYEVERMTREVLPRNLASAK